MEASQPTIELRRDQVFGWYARLEPALAVAVGEYLEDCRVTCVLEFPGAARLDVAGCTTVIFPGQLADVRARLVDYGVKVVAPAADAKPENQRYGAPVDQLLTRGDVRDHTELEEQKAVAEFSASDIPELIRMATDGELNGAPSCVDAVWAPIHAMRALGELRAEAAIAPLLGQLQLIDAQDDEYLGLVVPEVLAAIGPASLAPAANHLADERHGPSARLAAAKTLQLLGAQNPELRDECVHGLTTQLLAHPVQSLFFNAILISELLGLRAVESAGVIERAFLSGRVDESVCGDWEDVQIEFGFKLRRDRPRKPTKLTETARKMREAMGMPEINEMAETIPAAFIPPVPVRAEPKVGRNEPCPCGSGKKYKKCCGG